MYVEAVKYCDYYINSDRRSFRSGWRSRDKDLKVQLGLPNECDLEEVVLKMKEALKFTTEYSGGIYPEDDHEHLCKAKVKCYFALAPFKKVE